MDVLIGKVARELAALEEQLDRAFERALGATMRIPGRAASFRQTIDAYETQEGTVVHVDLAGVESKDVRLVVDGEYLQISGRRTTTYERRPEHHLQMEIPRGNFKRVIRLPHPYAPERVKAVLQAGILTIELPNEPLTSRKIPVRPA